MAKIITCTMCPWRLVCQELTKQVSALCDSHITYHGNQMVADIESHLQDQCAEETDG